jgi:predicted transcriptional regulator
VDRLLAYVFAGTRGGPTRIRIAALLLQRPRNINAIARELGLDYKTVDYNLRVLSKNRFVVCEDPHAYGALYMPSKNLLAYRDQFETLHAQLPPPAPPAPDLGKATSTEPGQEVIR